MGDALFHAAIQVAADGAFDQQQQDQPAVEHRDGEQVEDTEVQADGGHQAHQIGEALARRGSREARNADGAFERARREIAREDFPDKFKDQQGKFLIGGQGL